MFKQIRNTSNFDPAKNFDTIECELHQLIDAGVLVPDLHKKYGELAAACLIGYVKGTAADELNESSAGRLNQMDYACTIAEFFEGENFDFEEWYSKSRQEPDTEQDQGVKP